MSRRLPARALGLTLALTPLAATAQDVVVDAPLPSILEDGTLDIVPPRCGGLMLVLLSQSQTPLQQQALSLFLTEMTEARGQTREAAQAEMVSYARAYVAAAENPEIQRIEEVDRAYCIAVASALEASSR